MLVFISRYSNLPRIQKYYIITHILRIRNPFPSLPVTNKNNPFLSIFRRSLGISKPQPTSQRASIASQPMMIGSPWIKGGFVKKKLPVFGKIPCKSSPLKYRDLKTLIFFFELHLESSLSFYRVVCKIWCKLVVHMTKPVRQICPANAPCFFLEKVLLMVCGFPQDPFFCQEPFKRLQWLDGLSPCEYTFMTSLRYCNTVRLSSGSMLIKFMAGNHSPRSHQTTWFSGTPSVQNDNFVQSFFLFKNVWQKKMVQTPVVWRCFP